MTDDERDQINAVLAAHQEEFTEQSARLSATRLLVEDLFADLYTNVPDRFNQRMEELMFVTRNAAIKGNPATADAVEDQQVRVATHLQRFKDSVASRIEKRSAKG